jgi:hypothetical protein
MQYPAVLYNMSSILVPYRMCNLVNNLKCGAKDVLESRMTFLGIVSFA